jgi:uncharacterized protein YbjT (DUF2867 family)
MAEYVVAGATGHVGSVVAQSLLDSGRKVRVIVRDTHKAERWKKRGAHVGQVDLSNVFHRSRPTPPACGGRPRR